MIKDNFKEERKFTDAPSRQQIKKVDQQEHWRTLSSTLLL